MDNHPGEEAKIDELHPEVSNPEAPSDPNENLGAMTINPSSATPPDENDSHPTETNQSIVSTPPVTVAPASFGNNQAKKTSWRKRIFKSKSFVVVFLLLVVVLAGGLSYWKLARPHDQYITVGSFKAKVVQFRLVSTSPSNNATNVNTSSLLTLNFNEPINADKLLNNMFITPTLNGTFKQGDSPTQVVFAPAEPLTKGVKYSVMINPTLQNTQGTQLGVAAAYGFTTSIPSDSVAFQDQNGLIDNLTSLASGQNKTFSLEFGGQVGNSANVTLYKGSVSALLSSLVYANTTLDGYTTPQFSDLAVSTSGLSVVTSSQSVASGGNYVVSQPDGLYVAVATDSSGKELGFVWIDISNFGLLLRQDDQKTIIDAQSYASAQDVTANASFYNLNGAVNLLGQQTLSGLTTASYGFNQNLDIVVATYNNETAIVPVNVLNSGGDIRVDQNLSTAQAVYAITNKPTYSAGESIKFAGYVRLDNDAQYTNPNGGSVQLYVGTYKGDPSPVETLTVPVNADGTFNGSFTASASWLNQGDVFNQYQLFVKSISGNPNNDLSVASFTIAATTNQANTISVAFSKSSYLPSDSITATIKAINSSGQPLANQTIDVHTFSQDYYENNLAANQANFGYGGNELAGSPITVQLNAAGQATYTVNAASLPSDGNSQIVTVQANLPNQTGVGAAGGDSAIVHQGNGYIVFGPTRSMLPMGANLVSDAYAYQLDNLPIVNTTLQYVLVDSTNSNQLASGSVQTDSSGLGAIDIPSSQLANNGDSMVLKVSFKDQYGNTIVAQTYYSVANYPLSEQEDTSGAFTYDLNVTGSSGNLAVGDVVNLTINSPAAIRAMVTMDRGRIYNPSMLNLNQGNNTFSFTVTPNLAPSFTLTFNYFLNGIYHSEGVPFNVAPLNKSLNISIQAPSSISANQSSTLNITTTDSNNQAVPTSLIVDIISANSFALSNQVNPDILASFYAARQIMTSSSSSLSPVGSGGGRCGGGGGAIPSFANADGTTLLWQPDLQTNASGQASVSFNPPAGSWTATVYAMSTNTQVGLGTYTFNTQ